MRLAPLALALALSLGACATHPIIPPDIGVVVLQGDTSLDSFYNKAATAYLAAVPSMAASDKATLKPLMQKFRQAVVAADTAERLGDATTVSAQIAAAMSLYGQIKPILHLP